MEIAKSKPIGKLTGLSHRGLFVVCLTLALMTAGGCRQTHMQTVPDPQSPVSGLRVSASNGVAPLLVILDATTLPAAGVNRPFHELAYAWNFGDQGGKFAPTEGETNVATGPIAAHVYDEPGTYDVTLSVWGPGGTRARRQIRISVQDPDVVFAGNKTVCISRSGNFSGCPSGAKRVTAASLGTLQNEIASGRRILLRRGDAWRATTISLNVAGPGIIGAYGSGAKPKIRMSSAASFIDLSEKDYELDDWRVMDLDIEGKGRGVAVDALGTFSRVLLYRLGIKNIGSAISWPPSIAEYYRDAGEEHPLFADSGIVECDLRQARGGEGNTMIYVGGDGLAILGNFMVDSLQAEHVARIPHARRAVISDNLFKDAPPKKHLLRVHSTDYPAHEEYSELVVIRNNVFEDAAFGTPSLLELGPQNADSDERLKNFIVEGNHFVSRGDNITTLWVVASDVTIRNNTFLALAKSHEQTAIILEDTGIAPASKNIDVFNNSGYCNRSGSSYAMTVVSGATGVRIKNNIVSGGNVSELLAHDGDAATVSNNLEAKVAGFISGSPVRPHDFRLEPSSPAVNAGAATSALYDREGVRRPRGSAFDIGAYEH